MHIRVQFVLQLQSQRCYQDAGKDRPFTLHFIASVARGTDVEKVRSLTELSGMRTKVNM